MTRPSKEWIGKQVELTADAKVGRCLLQEGWIVEVTDVNPDATLAGRVIRGCCVNIPSFRDAEILGKCRVLMRDEYVQA